MAHFEHVVISLIYWAKINIGYSELLQLTKYINKLIWLLKREEIGHWITRLYIFIKYTKRI